MERWSGTSFGRLNEQHEPMSDTPNIDELRQKLAALDRLLADPHPGLLAWQMAYNQRVHDLLEFWHAIRAIK